MKTIKTHIASKQAEFAKHRFFHLLSDIQNFSEFKEVASYLTFWPMTFQDILRINEQKITVPYLRKIARHHRLEDKGHNEWFLDDVLHISELKKNVFKQKYGIKWLFDQNNEVIRDSSYSIMSEVFHLTDDNLRIILLETLESTGHVFFDKVSTQAKIAGVDKELKYFSSSHLEVEKAHAMFEQAMEADLHKTVLSMDIRRKAIALIDRVYDAIFQMFDALAQILENSFSAKNAKGVANIEKNKPLETTN